MNIQYQGDLWEQRRTEHDAKENEMMDRMRPHCDRPHLPDRRVSFSGVPVSWDLKTNIFVEDNSHDEYWRLWYEGEPVFIVYCDKADGEWYADWISNLTWAGPFPASPKSTTGDDYYKIGGGRGFEDFVSNASNEAIIFKGHCMFEAKKRGNI